MHSLFLLLIGLVATCAWLLEMVVIRMEKAQ